MYLPATSVKAALVANILAADINPAKIRAEIVMNGTLHAPETTIAIHKNPRPITFPSKYEDEILEPAITNTEPAKAAKIPEIKTPIHLYLLTSIP